MRRLRAARVSATADTLKSAYGHHAVVLAEGTTLLAETPIAITLRRLVRDGAAYLKLGDLLIFSIGGPAEIVGRTVEIRASIRSGTTVLAMDSRMVTIVDAM